MLWNRILLLHDNTENALKAVDYVGEMFGNARGVSVTLLGLLPAIPGHDLEGEAPGMDKLRATFQTMEVLREKGKVQLRTAVEYLMRSGIDSARIAVKEHEVHHGLAKEIASMIQEDGFGTIVIGAGGKQLLEVSTTDLARNLIKSLKGCTICVVT